MNGKFKSSKKKIKLSYVMMAVAVVLFTDIPIFYIMMQSMRADAINNSQAIFKNVAAMVDASLEKIDSFILNLTLDGSIERYLEHSMDMERFTPEDIEQIYSVQKNLSDIIQTNQYIDSIYIYNTENDVILTSSKGVFKGEDFEDNNWLGTAGAGSLGLYIARTNASGEQVLTTIRGVPMLGIDKKGYIVVNTEIDILNRFTNTGDVIVLNSEGDVLKATGKADTALLSKIPDSDSGSMKYRGRVVSWYASDYADFKYINVIGIGYIVRHLIGAMLLSLAVTAAGLVIVWLVIDYLSRMMYRPIEKIMEEIGMKRSDRSGEDELEYIAGCIRRFRRENKQLQANVRVMENGYNDRVVRRLLTNRGYSPEQLERIFANIGFEIKGEAYRVIMIDIDNAGRFRQENSEEERDLWRYGIINIAEEILGREYSCVFSKDTEIAGIINQKQIDSGVLRGLLAEIQGCIKEYFDISLTVASSGEVRGIDSVNEAYKQAMSTLDYKFISGGGRVLLPEDMPQTAEQTAPAFPSERLINAIRLKDAELIAKECGGFADSVIERGCLYKELVITEITGSLRKIRAELGADTELEYDVYSSLTNAETIYGLRDKLTEALVGLIDTTDENEAGGDNYAGRIMSYINENYRNPDISLRSISDEVGVSVSYVSTIVNSVAKTTLTNYINKHRIEDAKKILIQSPELPIEEVRELVGYTNVHSFIRQFKNFEGITPGKYRELNTKR